MDSRRPFRRPNGVILFNRIYAAAKSGEVYKLKSMTAAGIHFKLYCGAETPVQRLAAEGEVAAVNLILACASDAEVDELSLEAVEGYARGGNVRLVDAALHAAVAGRHYSMIHAIRAKALSGYAAQASVDLDQSPITLGEVDPQQRFTFTQHIIEGYAKGDQHDLVKRELERINVGADPMSEIVQSAIKGYALSGNREKVNEILDELKQIPNLEKEFIDSFAEIALYYFAVGGWVEAVNEMLTQYRFPVEALRGYAFGGHFNEMEMLLALLVATQDAKFETILAGQACKINQNLNLLEVTRKAAELRDVMGQYKLDYAEARRFLAQDERGILWMLQGPQLVAEGRLPSEIFERISAYVLGVEEISVRKIHAALNERLLVDSLARVKVVPRNRFISYFWRQNEDKRSRIQQLSELRGGYYSHSANAADDQHQSDERHKP